MVVQEISGWWLARFGRVLELDSPGDHAMGLSHVSRQSFLLGNLLASGHPSNFAGIAFLLGSISPFVWHVSFWRNLCLLFRGFQQSPWITICRIIDVKGSGWCGYSIIIIKSYAAKSVISMKDDYNLHILTYITHTIHSNLGWRMNAHWGSASWTARWTSTPCGFTSRRWFITSYLFFGSYVQVACDDHWLISVITCDICWHNMWYMLTRFDKSKIPMWDILMTGCNKWSDWWGMRLLDVRTIRTVRPSLPAARDAGGPRVRWRVVKSGVSKIQTTTTIFFFFFFFLRRKRTKTI